MPLQLVARGEIATTSGSTISKICSASVTRVTDTPSCCANTSCPPATSSTMKNVRTPVPIAVRTGRSRGRSSKLWMRRSPVTQASRKGHEYNRPKVMPGNTTPGQNTSGMEYGPIFRNHGGASRNAPSSQPTYQSGWAAVVTAAGS